MREKLLSAAVALYLFACILLGGSAQGIAFHLALQLAGIALIAWAIATPRPMPAAPAARALMWLVAAMLLLVALQWLPLPFALWRALPGRAIIADQLRLLGQHPATMALSLDPAASWSSAFQLIPPLAILIAIVRLGAYRAPWLIASLAAATLIAILLGIAQVASPDPLTSPFYLFPQANRGVATGTFANANHFAILLLTTIPFLAAGAAIAGRGSSKDAHGRHAILAGATIVVLTGLTLSRSLAVASLALPVCGASLLILHRPQRSARVCQKDGITGAAGRAGATVAATGAGAGCEGVAVASRPVRRLAVTRVAIILATIAQGAANRPSPAAPPRTARRSSRRG